MCHNELLSDGEGLRVIIFIRALELETVHGRKYSPLPNINNSAITIVKDLLQSSPLAEAFEDHLNFFHLLRIDVTALLQI